MPVEKSHDPRDTLVRRKYFSLRPQPLEQWLWKQGVAPSAERVFWLHWQEGMRTRDWCSSIPLKRVAALCFLDVSSVTRAYHVLASLGLIRRQDPGRDPSRPFERAVCLTEVRMPRELLQDLGRFPDRTASRRVGAMPVPVETTEKVDEVVSRSPTPPEGTADPFRTLPARERRQALTALLAALSSAERRQFHEALRMRQPHVAFGADSRLDEQGRAALLQFLEIAATKPSPATTIASSTAGASASSMSRKLTTFELARLRRDLHTTAGTERVPQLMREIVWAIEQGALARFTTLHGMRIALKKIREGAWTRPNRMPPNWFRELAHSDLCRTA